MKDYGYSPLLKKPEQMPDLDPLKPAMKPMLKIMARTQKKQIEAFIPPAGICREKTVIAHDGVSVETWIVQPEACAENSPAMILIHGGAFYLSLSVGTTQLAYIYAQRLGMKVFLPEYTLLPDAASDAAMQECLGLYRALRDNKAYGIDPDRILIYGESAGGALAAGMCLYLRDHNCAMPAGQILIYPTLDDRSQLYASTYRLEDAVWPLSANRHMWDAYLKDAQESSLPYLVPLRSTEFTGLPAAYIEPQEMDILCDEAIAYAHCLETAGVETELNIIQGSYHGFDADTENPAVQEILNRRMEAMKRMLTK